MKRTVLKMKPVFQEKIWGGNRMASVYGYPIPSDSTGECWAISAHPGGQSRVIGGEFDGCTLGQLWQDRPDLFGSLSGDFPLLIKIIDAREDLSIQVHPDDAYARVHENGALGKTECWYVLDCDENATIIIGHNASCKEEMAHMVDQGRWKELLREVPIHKGDFFQINPGCLHAIKGGTLILETQQSSDITYRFYDYGRLENGKPRQLHIEKSLAVTAAPFVQDTAQRAVTQVEDAEIANMVTCPYYRVQLVHLSGKANMSWDAPFINISVLEGSGTIDGQKLTKGEHLVLTAGDEAVLLEGNMELIWSYL